MKKLALVALLLAAVILIGCAQQTPQGNSSVATSNNTPANNSSVLNQTSAPPSGVLPKSGSILQGAIMVSELTAHPQYNASVKIYGIAFNVVSGGFYIGPDGVDKASVNSSELVYVDYENSNITSAGVQTDDRVVVTGTLIRHDLGQGLFSYEMLATKVVRVYPIPP